MLAKGEILLSKLEEEHLREILKESYRAFEKLMPRYKLTLDAKYEQEEFKCLQESKRKL